MPKRESNDPNDRRDQETANWCSAKNRHRVLKLVSRKIASYRMVDLTEIFSCVTVLYTVRGTEIQFHIF